MLAPADFFFAAFDAERFVQRDGLEIFDRHFFGEGDDVVEFVYFAHRVVEDAGDDAAVGVAGRSGVALAEAEAADESLAGFIEEELEAHAVGIVLSADEAVVFLHFGVAGVVALGLRLRWHGWDFTRFWERRRQLRFPHLAKEARCGAPPSPVCRPRGHVAW